MNAWQITLPVVGVAFDVFGLFLTGTGLFFTWRDHSEGEAFFPAMWSEFTGLLVRLAPRRRHTAITVGVASARAEAFAASIHGVVGFPPDATVEERLSQLKQELDRVSTTAAQAQHEVGRLREEAAKQARRLEERLTGLDTDVRERLREQTLRGLPLAVLGLILAGVGSVLQLAATLTSM